jgi:hypothetical protein
VRSEAGYVFGGFTSEPWTSPRDTNLESLFSFPWTSPSEHLWHHQPDPQAFLFSLTNAAGLPRFKVKAERAPQFAVNHRSNRFAVFGNRDLYIHSNAHSGAVSYTNWGSATGAYPLPPGAADKTFLVGDGEEVDEFGYLHFKVAELYVYVCV